MTAKKQQEVRRQKRLRLRLESRTEGRDGFEIHPIGVGCGSGGNTEVAQKRIGGLRC